MNVQEHVKTQAKLRIGFLLAPRFTLTAFAGFVDAFRLAADDGDLSRPVLVQWSILDTMNGPIVSSCGASINPNTPLEAPENYDYVVVVGGLLHGGQKVSPAAQAFLQRAAAKRVKLIGLCTGSFVLARAGLLDGYLSCVSWFHRTEFENAFPSCRVISNQMYVVDRDRLTCAGGTSVVHLAGYIIERTLGRPSAVKALRILIEEQPMPSRTLQPEQIMSVRSTDSVVHKAMLVLEQQLHTPVHIDELCKTLNIGRRQLERRFQQDVGLSPSAYRQRLRLERANWLLTNTDLEVIAIALECGFQNSTSFARLVRQFLGDSPLAIRKAARAARLGG